MSDDGSESEDPYQMCAAAGGDDSGDSAGSGGSSGGGGSGGAAAAAAAPARAGAADSDGADDFLPSPPRRKNRARAAGGAPAAGARGKQPKWKRTVMEWEMLPGGQAVLETNLEAFIEAHGRKVAAGRGFTRKGKWRASYETQCRDYACSFQNCPAMLKATKIGNGFAQVEKSISSAKQHNDHQEEGVRGLPGHIKGLLSPTKLEMPPKKLRAWVRRYHPEVCTDGVIPEKLKAQLTTLHETASKKNSRKLMEPGQRGRYGGLVTLLQKLEKSYLIEKGCFNAHTSFVLGEALVVEETERVTVAISTENLLLNAYRQSCFGLPSLICVDTTHRLIIEGHCCMLIGTMSPTQNFHTIAYGICSHEDTAAHEHVLHAVREAVNATVADRAAKKMRV